MFVLSHVASPFLREVCCAEQKIWKELLAKALPTVEMIQNSFAAQSKKGLKIDHLCKQPSLPFRDKAWRNAGTKGATSVAPCN
jgi:hypothetical protein